MDNERNRILPIQRVHSNLPKGNLRTHDLPNTKFVTDNFPNHNLPKQDDLANCTKNSQFAKNVRTMLASRPGIARSSLPLANLCSTISLVLSVIARRVNDVSVVRTTFWQIVIWQIASWQIVI